MTGGLIHTGAFRQQILLLSGVVLLLGTQPVFAQNVAAIRSFDEGTRLLNSGDFRGAIQAFEESEATGFGSTALFHNRGIAHYRLDELGRAVQYLEKALLISGDDARIRHSLDIVSSRLIDSYSELPVPIWTRFQRSVLGVVPMQTLLILGIGFYLILCTFLLMNILGYWRSSWHRRFRVVSAILAAVLISMALTSSIWPAYPQEGVIIVEETPLLEQPDPEAVASETLREGLVVSVVAEGADWFLIQLPNGARGWIVAETLGSI